MGEKRVRLIGRLADGCPAVWQLPFAKKHTQKVSWRAHLEMPFEQFLAEPAIDLTA